MLGKRQPRDGAAEEPLKLMIQLGGRPEDQPALAPRETNGSEHPNKVSQVEAEAAGELPGKDWQSSVKKKKDGLKATGNNPKQKDKGEKKTDEEEREEREKAYQKEQEELDKKLAAQENVRLGTHLET